MLTYTNELKFSKALSVRLAALGYSSQSMDDLIIEVIGKLSTVGTSEIANIKKAISEISTDTLKANSRTYGLGGASSDAVKIVNRSVNYRVDGENFTYDFNDLKKNLPTGFSVIGGGAEIVDSEGKRSSVRGTSNTLKVTSFPATAIVSLNIQTENGQLELEKKVQINNTSEGTSTLNIKDLTNAPADMSVKEKLELLAAEVTALKQKD